MVIIEGFFVVSVWCVSSITEVLILGIVGRGGVVMPAVVMVGNAGCGGVTINVTRYDGRVLV